MTSSGQHDDQQQHQQQPQQQQQQSPSAEQLASVYDRFTRLEDGIESFAAALERLTVARRKINLYTGLGRKLSTQDMRRSLALRHEAASTGESDPVPDLSSYGIASGPRRVFMFFVAGAIAIVLRYSRLRKDGRGGAGHHASSRREPGRTEKGDSCDVAFLAHPSSILSAFAVWLPEKKPLRRWQGSWWMIPAWPFILLLSVWNTYISPIFRGPYFVVDTFRYVGMENQVWLSRALGYQYMIKPLRRKIASGIEAAVREADRTGVSVLGLGALNKAEFINRGGEDVLDAFQPTKTRLVHGNTLTAAVVVENVKAAASAGSHKSSRRPDGEEYETCARRVFLTGATSKVGRAVALKLAIDGFDVVCCTGSDDRFNTLELELRDLRCSRSVLPSSSPSSNYGACGPIGRNHCDDFVREMRSSPPVNKPGGGHTERKTVGIGRRREGSFGGVNEKAADQRPLGRLLRARRVDEGVHHRLWVIGKCDASVRVHLPLNASAVVFAVPCPLEGFRPDVSAVSGGILRMDESACTPRQFHLLLPFDQMYACHAAAVVHRRMGWTHHEVGKVDVNRMDLTLTVAFECGFSIPTSERQHGSESMVISHGIPAEDNGGISCESSRWPSRRAPERRLQLAVSVRARGEGSERKGNTTSREGTNNAVPCSTGGPVREDLSNHGQDPCHGERHGPLLFLPRPMGAQGLEREPKEVQSLREEGKQRETRNDRFNGDASREATPTAVCARPMEAKTNDTGGASTQATRSWSHRTTKMMQTLCTERNAVKVEQLSTAVLEALPEFCRVLVVGAGASGLSVAACLRARGADDVLVLERSSSVCGSWAGQYEGLKITTRRAHCGLPGWPVPTEGFCDGKDGEISAEGFIRYLRGFQQRFDIEVVTGAEVLSAQPVSAGSERGSCRPGNICVGIRRGGPGGPTSIVRCQHLIVATGKNASPRLPPAILHTLVGFSGEIVHSSRVSGLEALAKRKVCIVGMGNSACDLAVALLEHGAGKVHISTRSAPPIIMREWGPLSLEWISRTVQYLPPVILDHVLTAFAAAKWGRGWRKRAFPKGLPQTWQANSSGRIPCIDKGSLVQSMLKGRIAVHGLVERAEGTFLRFQHSDVVEPFDTVILATGFDTSHERWIDPEFFRMGPQSGLHFVGFNNGRALLPLREIGSESQAIAARVTPR